LTTEQKQQAVAAKLSLLIHFNELIAMPVPEPELSAFRAIRENIKLWLLAEITELTPTAEDTESFWAEVAKFIVIEGLSALLEALFGVPLAPLIHVIGDPTPISGVETQVIDSLIIRKLPDSCYKIIWYRTKWADELIWGPVRIKVEKVPCD
jgi:hypothetical protein